MAKKLLGHTTCPECGFADAEVGEDKSGHPYRYCPDCNAQYFPRSDTTRVANLKKKIRPAGGVPSPSPVPAAAAPKKKGALDGFFGGEK